jgi:enterochelin esterase-like enzyme
VLGPQGTGFFLILIVAFGALLFWVAVAKQTVFRVFAACLAFLPAMVFGIAAVNKYYDYYQSWGALINDLGGSGSASIPKYSAGGLNSNKQLQRDLNRTTNAAEDAEVGYEFQTTIIGPTTHISRSVYIYLPPQYFQKPYAHYKFPAIELLHGSPGSPSAWVDVLDVIPTFLNLLANHLAAPAVLVMPDTDGGERYSLQCLNNPGGIQDMTYIAREVPLAVSRLVQVELPGKAWGVAGYSEGGYCAANLALNEPAQYGFAGIISGYFKPFSSQIPAGNKPGARPVKTYVFAKYPVLALRNTPSAYITQVPVGIEVPLFWLAAGAGDAGDMQAAQNFRQLASIRQTDVPLDMLSGGHTGSVWRGALGPMLTWMTPQLAQQVSIADANARAKKAAEQRAAAAQKLHGTKPGTPGQKGGTGVKPGTGNKPGTRPTARRS